jgi:hypothetical protein
MNCDQARPLLAAFVYGDLATADLATLQAHMADCPLCRTEFAALGRLRRQLDTAAATPVKVDLGRLYRAAAEARIRRWRRWAFAAAGMAAALLLGTLALRSEVRVEPHQVVLRWGEPLATDHPRLKDISPEFVARDASLPPRVEELQLLGELLLALSRDVERSDAERQAEIAYLQARIELMQRQSITRLAATERDVAALYALQVESRQEGVRP